MHQDCLLATYKEIDWIKYYAHLCTCVRQREASFPWDKHMNIHHNLSEDTETHRTHDHRRLRLHNSQDIHRPPINVINSASKPWAAPGIWSWRQRGARASAQGAREIALSMDKCLPEGTLPKPTFRLGTTRGGGKSKGTGRQLPLLPPLAPPVV